MRIFKIAVIETFASQVNTSFRASKGRTFLNITTDDPNIGKELINMGFPVAPFERGRRISPRTIYSLEITSPDQVSKARQTLQDIASRFNAVLVPHGLNDLDNYVSGPPAEERPIGVGVQQLVGPSEPVAPVQEPGTAVTTPQPIKNEVAERLNAIPEDKRKEYLDKQIENIFGTLVLEIQKSSSQEFIKSFLEFSKKFWNRSFRNQILLLLQWKAMGKPGSPEFVMGGKSQWPELGRHVKAGEKAMAQLAPDVRKFKKEEINTETGEKEERTGQYIRGWFTTYVFDKTQTEPFTGKALEDWKRKHPGKEPFEEPERDVWMAKQTDDTERTKSVMSALINLAAENEIDVVTHETQEQMGGAGGYAAEDYISLAYESRGERALATMIHEMAHHLIHWQARKDKTGDIPNRKLREIDADSVSYIVMKEFGFDSSHSPNYLALWGANKEEALSRQQVISETAKRIIGNIWLKLGVDLSELNTTIPPLIDPKDKQKAAVDKKPAAQPVVSPNVVV